MSDEMIVDQTGYNEHTMVKVKESLYRVGLTSQQISQSVHELQNQGILFRERVPDEGPDLKLGLMTLEEAITTALRASSTCWIEVEGAGVLIYKSERADRIADQLLARIRQAGPTYD